MPPKLRNNAESLTIDSIKELWVKEFLPSIQKELRSEIEDLKSKITSVAAKCDEIESSQKYLSSEYDNFKRSLQGTKKEVTDIKRSIEGLEGRVNRNENDLYNSNVVLDDVQQYLRRDCIEITGIPPPLLDSPKQLAVQVGEMIGLNVTEDHISTAHRLPPTKKVKNRIIVKFVHRDMKEAFYKNRSKLIGKKSKDVPLIASEYGKNIHESENIYINESLTLIRKKLLGRVNEFKRANKWRHLWTVNGKILLRQTDSSKVFDFTTNDQFEQFLQGS